MGICSFPDHTPSADEGLKAQKPYNLTKGRQLARDRPAPRAQSGPRRSSTDPGLRMGKPGTLTLNCNFPLPRNKTQGTESEGWGWTCAPLRVTPNS